MSNKFLSSLNTYKYFWFFLDKKISFRNIYFANKLLFCSETITNRFFLPMLSETQAIRLMCIGVIEIRKRRLQTCKLVTNVTWIAAQLTYNQPSNWHIFLSVALKEMFNIKVFVQDVQEMFNVDLCCNVIFCVSLHSYKYRNQFNMPKYRRYYALKIVLLFCRMLKTFTIVE